MNREEFNQAMIGTGSLLSDAAEALIRLAPDARSLTGRPYNFVPVGSGLYEIWKPGDRGDFFPAKQQGTTLDRPKFVGTLEEAYDWVFADRLSLLKAYGRMKPDTSWSENRNAAQ